MSADFGLLVVRVIVGLIVFGHGAQKLFGWFGGHGLKGTAGWLGSIGMQPASFWAFMAGLSESAGGLLLALGFLNPLGSLGILAAMTTAILKVHWGKGMWASKGGSELPLTNIAVALGVALAGPGAYSLDAILGVRLPEPITFVVGLVVVLIGIAGATLTQTRQEAHAS